MAMGRHVVISFDNATDAEEFIAAVKVAGAVFFMGSDAHFKNVNAEQTAVVGLFAKPNDFCECKYEGEMPIVRGSKFGLFVHTVCKKPMGGQLQSAPRNLLYPKDMDVRKMVAQERYVGLSVREGRTRWPVPTPEKESK